MELGNIAYINYTASGGGAARICSILHRAFPESYLYNKFEHKPSERIICIDELRYRNFLHKFCKNALDNLLSRQVHYLPRLFSIMTNGLTEPWRNLGKLLGREDFDYPTTQNPDRYLVSEPALIHGHNLFPDYFDLRSLILLSKRYPLLITAHDCWLMTGHCAHPLGCKRFKLGCGSCPDLSIPPEIKRDGTRYNIKRKKAIFSSSGIFLATPCEWLKKMFLESQVGPLFQEIRVIHNGVDTNIFHPLSNKGALREKYGIPLKSLVFSFVGNKISDNPWKNFPLMLNALRSLAESIDREVVFLCVGEKKESISAKNFKTIFFENTNDLNVLNELYNSSNFYLHLAKADSFPNTIIEAQSCGIPVLANPICGIREQISENRTGWFIEGSTASEVSEEILQILKGPALLLNSTNSRQHVLEKFSKSRMISNYRKYYEEIIQCF